MRRPERPLAGFDDISAFHLAAALPAVNDLPLKPAPRHEREVADDLSPVPAEAGAAQRDAEGARAADRPISAVRYESNKYTRTIELNAVRKDRSGFCRMRRRERNRT